MLYDYKFTLAQMGQIKNYKRDNKFEHKLFGIEDIELATYKIECKVYYKKTVPLNMFEKYSIRLIEKADEVNSNLSVNKIANLLHLDESLVRENLENLGEIDMLHGIDSDVITINRDENSIYLQYENKFKIESTQNTHHLTKSEHAVKEEYIEKEFEQNKDYKDKKFKNLKILDETKSSKSTYVLNYSNNNFLIYSKDGINQKNDLKFIDTATFSECCEEQKIENNIFCHYDEFLPLLRDKLAFSKGIVIIGSKGIDKDNLDVLKVKKDLESTFILSESDKEHERMFNIEVDDFAWIGDEFYLKEEDFIVKSEDITFKKIIKQKLNDYFLDKILEIEPSYDTEKFNRLNLLIEDIENQINEFKFQTKKEIEEEVKKINTEKNKLYGLTSKNSKTKRKQIDKLQESNNLRELEKYSEYIKNRDLILDLKSKATLLEKDKDNMVKLESELSVLNQEKSTLIFKENKSKIKPLEMEINKLKRLKI